MRQNLKLKLFNIVTRSFKLAMLHPLYMPLFAHVEISVLIEYMLQYQSSLALQTNNFSITIAPQYATRSLFYSRPEKSSLDDQYFDVGITQHLNTFILTIANYVNALEKNPQVQILHFLIVLCTIFTWPASFGPLESILYLCSSQHCAGCLVMLLNFTSLNIALIFGNVEVVQGCIVYSSASYFICFAF